MPNWTGAVSALAVEVKLVYFSVGRDVKTSTECWLVSSNNHPELDIDQHMRETMAWFVDLGTNNASTEAYGDSSQSRVAMGITICILATLGVLLNFLLNPLMLLALRHTTSIQPTTKIFMMSLTVSDLFMGVIWLLRLPELYLGMWPLGSFLCAACGAVAFTTRGMGIYSLLLITVDRYIAISHPLRYPTLMTVYRSKVIVCIKWLVVTAFSISVFGIYKPKHIMEKGPLMLCMWRNDWRIHLSIFCIVCALSVVFVLYLHVSLIAQHQVRRIASENQAGNGLGMPRALQRMNTRSTTTVAIITGTLTITWIPMVIVLAKVVEKGGVLTSDDFLRISLVDVLMAHNSWLNVVIYYLRNRDLRQALHILLSDWHRRICGESLPQK